MKHPRRWLWFAAGVVALSLGIGRAILTHKARQAELAQSSATARGGFVQLVPSDWTTAQVIALARTVDVSGSLRAMHSAVVKARVGAELKTLRVREGDTVQQGQLIGTLDPQEFETRLRQAREQAATARAQDSIAQQTLESNRALVEQGFISKNALQTSVSNAAAARATWQAASAAADLAQTALRDTRLIAPIDGLVSQRFAQAGERVAAEGRVVEIVDLRQMELQATLSPADVAQVQVGRLAQLQVDGLPAPVKARVARINPSASAGTRGIVVYLALEPQAGLRQGLFAQGRIELDQHQTLAVPQSAVRTDGTRAFVQVIDHGQVRRRAVTLGEVGRRAGADARSALMVAIRSGLESGEQVLQGSVGTLDEGSAVRLDAAPAR